MHTIKEKNKKMKIENKKLCKKKKLEINKLPMSKEEKKWTLKKKKT